MLSSGMASNKKSLNRSGSSYSSQRRRVRESVVDILNSIGSLKTSVPTENDISELIDNDNFDCGNVLTETPDAVVDTVDEEDNYNIFPDNDMLDFSDQDDFAHEDYSNRWYSSSLYGDNEADTDSSASDDDSLLQLMRTDETLLPKQVAEWTCRNSVTQTAVNELLSIFRPFHACLPADARTLLKTPTVYEIRDLACQSGQYHHFGIEKGILLTLKNLKTFTAADQVILQFNIDGLPLFKSSAVDFWPILGLIKQAGCKPFLVGLYCGKKKPLDVADYLKDFIPELHHLLQNGLVVNDSTVPVKVDCFVCDAPARAYLKNIKSHCAYFGCEKCQQEGDHVNNKMTFPLTNAPLRNDEDFNKMTHEEHHHGPSALSVLPIGLVTDFVYDYMHLVCLGVVRRLLNYWLKGPPRNYVRLSASSVDRISGRLCNLARLVPCEFARRPRSLTELDRWKATELRQLLLYTGPTVLHGIVSDEVYDNFMLLSVGIRLLASSTFNKTCIEYAHNLLTTFVNQSAVLYGADFVVYNVHGLVHLADDVKKHGSLDSFSAFPFENYLKAVKKSVRKACLPLPQVIRRMSELAANSTDARTEAPICSVSMEHFRGPLTDGFECSRQFQRLKMKGFCVKLTVGNNCVIARNRGPVLVKNILQNELQQLYVVCQQFQTSCDLFTYPLSSPSIGIVKVSGIRNELFTISVEDVIGKCVCIPGSEENDFAVYPLIH